MNYLENLLSELKNKETELIYLYDVKKKELKKMNEEIAKLKTLIIVLELKKDGKNYEKSKN